MREDWTVRGTAPTLHEEHRTLMVAPGALRSVVDLKHCAGKQRGNSVESWPCDSSGARIPNTGQYLLTLARALDRF